MRTPSLVFCTLLLMCSANLAAQLSVTSLITPLSDNSYTIPANSSEVVDKRNQYQRVFKTEDGRIIYQTSKSPLNYKSSNGDWKPVNIVAKTTSHGFIAEEQNNPVALGFDGSVEMASPEGSVFTLKTMSVFGEVITDLPIANKKINPNVVTNKNQYFTFLTEQTLQRSEFKHNGLKLDYIFQNPVAINNGVITQQLICDASFKVGSHTFLSNALQITNAKGEEMGILYPIICKDASGKNALGKYSFQKNALGYEISLQLDVEWLNDPARTYPLIVDPLIIGPTAVFGPVYIPSCFLPSYGVDSLLVNIPGQTTITGVFCTGNYYADVFAGAIKAEGFMHFSSVCGAGPDLSVYPPNTGWDTPGPGVTLNSDFRNPLTCCLGPSCTDRTFYVRMHIGRNAGGPGCNTNYIYYDPFVAGYPFSVFVEGRTVESGGAQWLVNPTTLCSDVCNFTIKPYVRFGVPPFTITHPWTAATTNLGTPVYTCAFTLFNVDIPLTRPNCPIYCDTTTTINIPLPTITDACGNTVSGMPAKILTIKPTPEITIATDSVLVCANEPAPYTFVVCPAGTTVNWSTPGFYGINTIDTSFVNPGPGIIQTTYAATASLNGCVAIPDTFSFYASPNPVAASNHPLVAQIQEPVSFTDLSNYYSGNGNSWLWTFGDGSTAPDSSATHQYLLPGTYNVCLYVNSTFGCMDTICDTIKIIPNNLILPNVLSTNGDGLNDVLYFQYLPYYGISTLSVFNRWGEIVFESNDYQNNWQPTNLVDGTYFYIVTIPGHDPYTSTLTIFNKE